MNKSKCIMDSSENGWMNLWMNGRMRECMSIYKEIIQELMNEWGVDMKGWIIKFHLIHRRTSEWVNKWMGQCKREWWI